MSRTTTNTRRRTHVEERYDEQGPRRLGPPAGPHAEPIAPPKRWLTDREVQQLYPFLKAGTMRWRRHQGLPPVFHRIGDRSCVYNIDDIEEWLRSCAVRPAADGEKAAL